MGELPAESPAAAEAQEPEAEELATGAESPAAEGSDNEPEPTEESLLETLSSAVDSSEESEDVDESENPESEDAQTGDSEQEQAAEEGEQPESEDEVSENEELPFNRHPRFRQLIRQRNELKQARQELNDQLEQIRPHAEQYQQIEQFMQQNELAPQDVAEGFRIMALMMQDPAGAREALLEHVQRLDQFTGHQLPQDLQQQVDEGLVTEELAREIAGLRNQSQFTQQRSQRQIEQLQQQQTQDAQARALEGMTQAVDQWEAQTANSDPDYARKQPLVTRELRLLSMDNPPQNVDDALALAKQAYANVNEQLRSILPPKREIRPGPSSADSAASSNAPPNVASYLDAVRQAVEG